METHHYLYLLIITLCVFFSAYFSATETAFNTFNRIRMKNLAEKGDRKAARVIKLSESYDTLISTILIGNNIVNILASSLATLLFAELIRGNVELSATVSTLVMTLVILIFGEISPKTISKINPDKFAIFSAGLINTLLFIFRPLSAVFKLWQNLLAKIFKADEDQGMTEEELISIIEEAEEDGDLDKEESDLIKSAIEFNDLEVSDIFTPRIDITAVRSDVTKEEMAKVFSESGYSRIPIYDDDLDNITGIVYYKDFFTTAFKTAVPIFDIVKPVMYVTKTMKINDLMKDLQEKQMHFAVVTDEYGSTAGIVTLEDILEEIVGEIWDEHDEIVEEIKNIGEGEYIVSGMTNLEKFYEELSIGEVDEETDVTTVNGWAMDTLGRIPEEGDTFEHEGLVLKVLKMDGRRIQDLHILDNRESEEETSENSEE